MDMIIKNGTIITADDTYQADIVVKDGKVAMIGQNIDIDGLEVIDASGKYVLPGAIDAHTHMELPSAGTISADSCEAGTRAAACGGVTMIIDFAAQEKSKQLIEAVSGRRAIFEPQACIDFAFHAVITNLTADVLGEFEKISAYGISSFKMFMAYKKQGMMVNDSTLAAALKRSKETGTLITVHAEDGDLVDQRIEKLLSEGKTSPWHHYESRPEFVEAEADKRVINLAKSINAPLYIVHLANKEGMEEVAKAREEGYEIYAETCPHYLNFTNEVYKREDGRYFVCSPPIKGKESQDALWDGIKNGDIATVATDHCPFQSFEKDWGKDDFTKIPNGCMGVENLYPYMLSEANKGRITFNKAVELCSTNVAKIFGCAPEKGTLEVGGDADIVIYDPDREFIVTKENMHSDVDHTIWQGIKFKGYPIMTFSRGKLVFKEGEFVGEPGWGRFVKRRSRK